MNKPTHLRLPSFLTRNVIILSCISFFTDIATEMLYPIMPLYLSDIGYGVVLIGLIEGVTQAVAGLVKLFSGVYSDHLRKRKGLVNLGYGVSALAKPLMGVFSTYWAIFGFRILDRLGKGIRSAPRDALLVDVSTPVTRGRVFGFHRAMDTLGATIGPLITLGILYFYRENIPLIIALTVIPGGLAVIAGLFIEEQQNRQTLPTAEKGGVRGVVKRLQAYWHSSPASYKRVLWSLVILTLLKSTDIYLLLRARELGLSDVLIISAYVLYNLVGALLIYWLGALSDRIGFAKTFAIGALSLSVTYALLSQNQLPLAFVFIAFAIYAIFQSVYEGLTGAWISLHIDEEHRATGIGLLFALQAGATFIGALVVGGAWALFGAKLAFIVTALLALIAAFYLYFRFQEQDYTSKTDHGRKPYTVDIKKATLANSNFRTAIWTGQQLQVTVMSIPHNEEIGLEAHKNIDQFLRIESGSALVEMGEKED
ncbi:MAG: MFS transporter, partial [Micrococcaceae bacterium]